MKISSLLRREPFKDIIVKTIKFFLEDTNKKKYEVEWLSSKNNSLRYKKDQIWYCNPLINSIFVKNVNKNVFNSINGEYLYNPLNPWKSIFQKIYIFLAQNKYTNSYLASYIIKITPLIKDSENKLIIGGNNKIRIIDISENKIYVILKDGFNKKFIEKELYVRKNFSFLPLTTIYNIGSDNKWYSEKLINGVPPNRLKYKYEEKIIINAVEKIQLLIDNTRKKILISKYLKLLKVKIDHNIKNLNLNERAKFEIHSIFTNVESNLKKHENEEIYICYCHGDFHQGNILTNNNKFWIMDWEHSGIRQILYDLIILLIDSRIETGFNKRFLKLYNLEMENYKLKLIKKWPYFNWDDKILKFIYINLFLIEDLIFFLNEVNNKFFYKKSHPLKNRLEEIRIVLQNI